METVKAVLDGFGMLAGKFSSNVCIPICTQASLEDPISILTTSQRICDLLIHTTTTTPNVKEYTTKRITGDMFCKCFAFNLIEEGSIGLN